MSSMDMATASHPMEAAIQNPHGFWSAVRDVVRCNRKDGKRWQCSREVVPGQKYCERHVGRGRNRPKRSAEDCSATSEVPCGPSLGAISSVSMAVAAQGGFSVPAFNGLQPQALPSVTNEVKQLQAMRIPFFGEFPSGFEKVARVKMLYDRVRSNFPCFDPSIVNGNPVFMDNAGGSQCAQVVIDALANYMKTSYVQPGAGYELSRRATETVKAAHDHMKTFANAHGAGEVVIGPSASQLLANLSDNYSDSLREGDEIIIHDANHEANVAPWLRVASRRGASVVWWRINYDTFESNLEDLESLLTPRTRIVAVPHVSNLLGEILDLEKVVKLVKSRIYEGQVRVIADGAAYTPHRAVDVAKWGVDWYVFSSYKAFGPHIAVLFGVQDAFAEVQDESPCWEFSPRDVVTRKFELGDVSHEACAGLVALTQYLVVLSRIGEAFSTSSDGGKKALQQQQQQQQHPTMSDAGGHGENGGFSLFDTNPRADALTPSPPLPDGGTKSLNPVGPLELQPVPQTFMEPVTPSTLRDWEFALRGTSFGREGVGFGGMVSSRLDRVVVEAAYDTITLLEQPLQEKLLAYLRSRSDVVIVGPKSAAAELRIPTVSFVHETKRSSDIAEALQSAGFAVRHGHMYSFCLLTGLESHKRLTVNSMMHDGVVRISLVHYNTPIEVASLIACLQATL